MLLSIVQRVAFLCNQLGIYELLRVSRCFPLFGAFGSTSFAPLGAIGALVSDCYWLCRPLGRGLLIAALFYLNSVQYLVQPLLDIWCD